MTIGTIIDRLLKLRAEALLNPIVRKPYSWALYETWKWVDEHEKPRKIEVDTH